jgi:hypothetical protein
MIEIELGFTDDELKDRLRSLRVPDNVINHLFYKDKKTNFLIFIAICLLLIGLLIRGIIA